MENKKSIKGILLQSSIGDWTTFKPEISEKKKNRTSIRGSNKLSEDELSGARMLFLELFEQYMNSLQKNVGIPFSARSISIDQMTYPEILKEWDFPVAQFKLSQDEEEPWQICFDSALANSLINRAVGGELTSQILKSLTEIEENILSECIKEGLEILTAQNEEDIALQFVNYPNLFFDQSYSESSPFIVFSFKMGMGQNQKGTIILILPVKPVRRLIEERKQEFKPISLSKLPPQITDKIKIPVQAHLGTAFITAKELYDLEIGDVVLLDTLLSSPLHVKIGEGLQLFGQPGIKGNKISISLLQTRSKKLEIVKNDVQEIENQDIIEEAQTDDEASGMIDVDTYEETNEEEKNTEEIVQ